MTVKADFVLNVTKTSFIVSLIVAILAVLGMFAGAVSAFTNLGNDVKTNSISIQANTDKIKVIEHGRFGDTKQWHEIKLNLKTLMEQNGLRYQEIGGDD